MSHCAHNATVMLSAESFKERVEEFKRWLAARPETVISVVAHWGLIYELTGGVDFANCVSMV